MLHRQILFSLVIAAIACLHADIRGRSISVESWVVQHERKIILFDNFTSSQTTLLLALRPVSTVSTTFQAHSGSRMGTGNRAVKTRVWQVLDPWRLPLCQSPFQYREKPEVAWGQVWTVWREGENNNTLLLWLERGDLVFVETGVVTMKYGFYGTNDWALLANRLYHFRTIVCLRNALR